MIETETEIEPRDEALPAPPRAVRVPLVALVGRPNVGKSTLFNRLVGRRTALVYDEPGVTRDRIFGALHIDKKVARLVDTGGLDPRSDDIVLQQMHAQTQLAIDEADLVLFVVDGVSGLSPADRDIAQALRRAGKRCAVVVNKADVAHKDELVADFYALGMDPVFPVSAEHGRGMEALEAFVVSELELPEAVVTAGQAALPVSEDEPAEGATTQIEWKGAPIHLAVIGRPNAGKSSLVNCVLGEARHLASEVPGTTRDAIDSEVERDGQAYVFIDTAGIRRKRSIAHRLESFAVVAAFNSMDRADVILLVLDGTVPPTDQDAKIASMAHDKGKGLVVVINKWDLVENPEWRERYMKAVRLQLPFADYAPIVKVSAKTGRGLRSLFAQVLVAQQERHRRVSTGELNRFFREVVASHPPPIRGGKRPQLFFVSQPLVRPPTFVFAASRVDDLHFSYIRYLSNTLRKRYGFEGTPIWLKFRAHRKPRSEQPLGRRPKPRRPVVPPRERGPLPRR
jgi:GTP-binding protein